MDSERFSRFNPFGHKKEQLQPKAPFSLSQEPGRYQLYTREFDLPPESMARLSERDKDILESLCDAAKGIAAIYREQEGISDRANFYPKKATRQQVLKAGEDNPEILSHYTVVAKDQDGQLVAIPVHQVFRDKLRPVVRSLRDAANRSRDFKFQTYLRLKASSLENGDYQNSEQYWLSRSDEPKIDAVIGFYDTNTDRFLGIKYSAESWVGICDDEAMRENQPFLESFLKWWENNTGKKAPTIKMRLEHTVLQTGQAAKYEWIANSLPCQPEWRRSYDNKFVFNIPSFDDKFDKRILPAFRNVIHPNKRMGVTDSMLKKPTLRRYIAHEISHSLDIPIDIEKRLKQHATWVKEFYCELLALKGYSQIGGLNARDREPEIAMATEFTESYLEYLTYKYAPGRVREEYYRSSSILLKYCLGTGSIRFENGHLTWDNHTRVYDDIHQLQTQVQEILTEGTDRKAKEFFKKYFDPKIYEPFSHIEAKIHGENEHNPPEVVRPNDDPPEDYQHRPVLSAP